MNWSLLLSIIKNMVIPEIAEFMRRRQADTGTLPTPEEVEVFWIAKLKADVDRIQAEGQQFLDTTRPQP